MVLRIPKPQGTIRETKAAASRERLAESSRRREETSSDLLEGFPGHDRHDREASSFPASALQRPEARARPPKTSFLRAALSQLPDELKLMVTTELSYEDALYLRQASSDFLRLNDDPQMIRDQHKKAGLALPKEGLETPKARDAAWKNLGQLIQLHRKYTVGPTSVQVAGRHFRSICRPTFFPDGRFVLAPD